MLKRLFNNQKRQNNREYTGKDLLYVTATGAINGLLSPVTNGICASVTKTVGTKLGLTVVKETGEASLSKINSNKDLPKISISDHTYMRMIDRNLCNTVKNNDGTIIGYSDFIELLASAVQNTKNPGKNVVISGVQGASGIKMIVQPIYDGKKLSEIRIESVM